MTPSDKIRADAGKYPSAPLAGTTYERRRVAAPAPRYLMRLDLIDRLLDRLPRAPESFLEIGPGQGDIAQSLLDRFPGTNGVAVDMAEQSIEQCRARFAGDPRMTMVLTDAHLLAYEKRFDIVVACEVLEHIEDDRTVIRRIHDALRPNGHAILSVPAFAQKWEVSDRYVGHVRRYERDDLLDKLRGCGFEIDACWCYGFPVAQLLYPFRQAYYTWRTVRRSARNSSQRAASAASGVERAVARALRRLPMEALLRPFASLQYRTRHTALGDGFIVLAHRVP